MKYRDNNDIFDSGNFTATISVGGTQSGIVDLNGFNLLGIYIPSTFDGTTITMQASPTLGGSYGDVMSGGAVYSLTVAAGKYVPIENLAITAGLQYVKFTAGSAQAGTDTILTLATRPV